jgi:hypothetical protein
MRHQTNTPVLRRPVDGGTGVLRGHDLLSSPKQSIQGLSPLRIRLLNSVVLWNLSGIQVPHVINQFRLSEAGRQTALQGGESGVVNNSFSKVP